MSKLTSLAKVSTYKIEFPENNVEAFEIGFQEGFIQAFTHIKEQLNSELTKLEQYPMMTERRLAIITYMKKMDTFLEEVQKNEY